MSGDFTPDQKRYLEGFVSGLQAARVARGLAPVGSAPAGASRGQGGPDAAHFAAQDRQAAAGLRQNAKELPLVTMTQELNHARVL